MAIMNDGINISAKAQIIKRRANNTDNASEEKVSALRILDNFFDKIGMKALLKAPSAKRRLNILGREKAIKKASAMGPEPKKFAINMSLANPSILLAIVHKPTMEKLRSRK